MRFTPPAIRWELMYPVCAEINHTLDTWLRQRRFHFLFLALLAGAVLFAKLHVGDLSGFDDAVYAHEGKTMLLTGDWWNVRLNGQFDFDKPPLFIWLEAFSMLFFGINDFAARFPAALLGWGTILLVYFIARELSAEYWLPVLAMFSLLTTEYFMKWAMHAMTDVPFAFCFALAVFAYLKARRQPRYLLLCGLALAAGIMIRSILGLIPLGVLLAHLAVTRRASGWRSKWSWLGLALALGLPLLWFGAQYRTHGAQFLALHFSYTAENLSGPQAGGWARIFGGGLEYLVQMAKSCWLWLPLMAAGFALQTKAAISGKDQAARLLLLWVLGVIVPFSLIQNRWLRYLLPAFPALSILAAVALNRLLAALSKPVFFKYAYVVLIGLAAVIALAPKYRTRPEEMRRLAPLAETLAPADARILLYTFGERRMDYLSQVVWYANRECEHLTELDDLAQRFKQTDRATVIIDKTAFARLPKAITGEARVLAESENFVCVGKMETQTAASD